MNKISSLFFFTSLAISSPAWCGSGTYTPGSPDEILLHVNFEYNERFTENWHPLFREASSLLFDASEKQIKISKVIFYNRCKENKADIRIYRDLQDARSNGDGLGRSKSRIRLSQRHLTVTTTGAGDRGQVGLVHELGHYVFRLLEEYRDKNGARSFCIAANGQPSSLMDAGTGRKPQRTEFCMAANHRRGMTEQDNRRLIGSRFFQDTDSWTFIVNWIQERYGAQLALPAVAPVPDPSGFDGGPAFEPGECDREVSIGVAGSARPAFGPRPGNAETALDLAKQGARELVHLLDGGDVAGVVSSEDLAISPMREMTTDNKFRTLTEIRRIQARGEEDWTHILQRAFTLVGSDVGAGGPTAPAKGGAIVLVSDGSRGPDRVAEDLLSSLRRSGVAVHVIGLGDGNTTGMRQVATDTAGSYLHARNARQVDSHVLATLAKIKSLEVIEAQEGSLSAGKMEPIEVPVDEATNAEAVDFVLISRGNDLDLQLIAPDGTRVSPRAEDTVLLNDSTGRLTRFRVWQPAVGTWKVEVSNKSAVSRDFAFQAHSLSTEVTVAGHALSDIVDRNTPLAIRAVVNTDDPVGGARATAWVESPDGQRSELDLFDDGSEEHGDDRKNDGVYSNYFREYRDNGDYTVEVTVSSTEARTVTPEEDEDFISKPVPPFVRKDRFSVKVTSAPK